MSEQKLLTPQQELFLALYTNPKSETFSNALQSALKAGYTQTYAENITTLMPDWLLENIGKMNLLKKAEKVMNKTLDLEAVDEKGKTDNQLLAIQNKTAHFVAETLGKNTGYSKRTELTGKDGEKLQIQFAEVFKKDA